MGLNRQRLASGVKWVSVLVTVAALLVIARLLPIQNWLDWLRQRIDTGVWGAILFGLIYVAATVLFVPGLILTIAAGAVFGLLTGTLIVSLASTTGAALAFLIARYLARDKVAEMARRNPKFDAIDKAIGEGGWKIVALLRLSPAVPFNLQNYLYGLTPIRFWPYVLTSWLAMAPGTLMYVYIGHVTGVAVGGERRRSPAEWVALGVGLAATIGVTVYVTYLARKQLQKQTHIADAAEPAPDPDAHEPAEDHTPAAEGWPGSATIALAVAILAVAAAIGLALARK